MSTPYIVATAKSICIGNLLWNDDQSGYIQQLRAVENRIFDLFDAHKTEWEQNGLDTKEIQRLYKEVDKLVNKAFLGLQKS